VDEWIKQNVILSKAKDLAQTLHQLKSAATDTRALVAALSSFHQKRLVLKSSGGAGCE
jgi:hypothetical protein